MGNFQRNRPVREYNKFCKQNNLCKGEEITVKVNKKFAFEFTANYTIPPEYWT